MNFTTYSDNDTLMYRFIKEEFRNYEIYRFYEVFLAANQKWNFLMTSSFSVTVNGDIAQDT